MSSSQADSQVCGSHFFGQGAIRSGMNSGDHYLQPQPRHTEMAGWLIVWASQKWCLMEIIFFWWWRGCLRSNPSPGSDRTGSWLDARCSSQRHCRQEQRGFLCIGSLTGRLPDSWRYMRRQIPGLSKIHTTKQG